MSFKFSDFFERLHELPSATGAWRGFCSWTTEDFQPSFSVNFGASSDEDSDFSMTAKN